MRSRDFSIVDAEFTAVWVSGRYGILLSRPEHYAIARNGCELANETEYCFFKRLIRAKKLAGARAFEWLRSVSQEWLLGIRIDLAQDRAPELSLGRDHGRADPNGAVRFHQVPVSMTGNRG